MPSPTLIIGTPNTSSWSLRPWLLMRHFDLAFDEIVIPLRQPATRAEILRHSPAGHVPILKDGDVAIWESLAIIEYLADRHPEYAIWPKDRLARAHARSLAAEMHAGFPALREELPVDVTGHHPGFDYSDRAASEIARILEIWQTALEGADKGPFLFGAFSGADAMYAPVVSRFVTYDIKFTGATARYREVIWELPAMAEWRRKSAQWIG